MDDVYSNIKKLYNKSGYFARFGQDVWFTIFTFLIFFFIFSYIYVFNQLKPIKADWLNKRCNPSVIPFAGIINKAPEETAFEFTQKNFVFCTQNILRSIIGKVFVPFYYMMNVITLTFVEFTKALVAIRGQFNKLRNSTTILSKALMGRLLNITAPIVTLIIAVKSLVGKLLGTFTASIYVLLGSYMGFKSLLLTIFEFIVKILYILVGVIAGLWATAWIFPANIPVNIPVKVNPI